MEEIIVWLRKGHLVYTRACAYSIYMNTFVCDQDPKLLSLAPSTFKTFLCTFSAHQKFGAQCLRAFESIMAQGPHTYMLIILLEKFSGEFHFEFVADKSPQRISVQCMSTCVYVRVCVRVRVRVRVRVCVYMYLSVSRMLLAAVKYKVK